MSRRTSVALAIASAFLLFVAGFTVGSARAQAPRPAVASVIGADIPAVAQATTVPLIPAVRGLPGAAYDEPDPLQQAGAPVGVVEDPRGHRPPTSAAHGASSPLDAPSAEVRGVASHVGRQYGRLYLALPQHKWGRPGITVTIRGAGGSVIRTSTDAGPNLAMQRKGRVADLNAWDFEKVCGLPASAGLCRVTVDYGPVYLPQTDR